jgi:hypothetical protein
VERNIESEQEGALGGGEEERKMKKEEKTEVGPPERDKTDGPRGTE